MQFLLRLEILEEEARDFIIDTVRSAVRIPLTPEAPADIPIDTLDCLPEFVYYDEEGGCECVAAHLLAVAGDGIDITGVLKGRNYPKTFTTNQYGLNAYDTLELADFLSDHSIK